MKTRIIFLLLSAIMVASASLASCSNNEAPAPIVVNQIVTVVSATPMNNASDTSIDAAIKIVFDYLPAQIDPAQFTLKDTNGNNVADVQTTADGSNRKTYIMTHANLAYNTTYPVTVPATAVGGLQSDYSFQFSTVEKTSMLIADMEPAAEPTSLKTSATILIFRLLVAESPVSGIQETPGFFGTANNKEPNSPTGNPRIYEAGEKDKRWADFLEFDKIYTIK
ncbi:MAG: Ig-like domain-containing protein [Dysgonamonadaceae bacterium]|jgi:hypothetical protein|nr:Ig-like domain-containing protein [Dysgonamonadaceae bacterium]